MARGRGNNRGTDKLLTRGAGDKSFPLPEAGLGQDSAAARTAGDSLARGPGAFRLASIGFPAPPRSRTLP